MENNPFTLSFGIEPNQYISRHMQINEIIDAFKGKPSTSHVYMMTGVRGSGKTVLLSNLCDRFSKEDDWIVINLIPDTDMINSLLAKLYSRKDTGKLIVSAKIDLSALGFGVSFEKEPIYDAETALERILRQIEKKGKKLLVAVDEIVNNDFVRIFAATFQLLIREKLPIYLLMTGLYDNIHNLQNEKSLTFLYRAPKVTLEPLSINAITRSYREVLKVSDADAEYMAKLTKGYAFAYQVLGYLYWNNNTKRKRSVSVADLIPEFEEYLESYVYEKIWSELSAKERDIIGFVSDKGTVKIADIREALDMTSGQMSVYRERLIKRGVLETSGFGYVSLKLPQFGEIIKSWL